MKKLIFILITIASFLIISSCDESVKEDNLPTAKVKFHSIKEISLVKRLITLKMSLDLYNPYPVDGNLKEIEADILIQNNKLSTITFTEPKAKANTTTENPFDVTVKLDDLYKIYTDIEKRKTVNIFVKGRVQVEIAEYGSHTFNFNHSQDLPAIKPKLEVSNFNVERSSEVSKVNINPMITNVGMAGDTKDKLTGKTFQTLSFDLKITNLTLADLSFSNIKVNLINRRGRTLISTTSEQAISSTKTPLGHHEEVYRIASKLNIKASLKSIVSQISTYRIKGSVDVNLPNPFGTNPIDFSQKL